MFIYTPLTVTSSGRYNITFRVVRGRSSQYKTMSGPRTNGQVDLITVITSSLGLTRKSERDTDSILANNVRFYA